MEFFTKTVDGPYPWTIFAKKSILYYLRVSEFDPDLKHSDKEYIYLTIDILRILHMLLKPFIIEFKEKETCYS